MQIKTRTQNIKDKTISLSNNYEIANMKWNVEGYATRLYFKLVLNILKKMKGLIFIYTCWWTSSMKLLYGNTMPKLDIYDLNDHFLVI
jgi:hypothetical protein